MNLKVAGLFGVAVIAFVTSIYWIGNLGSVTNPTNAMAGFFLFQSYCSLPPVESVDPVAPGSVTAKGRATDRPRNAASRPVVVVASNAGHTTTIVVIVNH